MISAQLAANIPTESSLSPAINRELNLECKQYLKKVFAYLTVLGLSHQILFDIDGILD
jgi:hypothetical protein